MSNFLTRTITGAVFVAVMIGCIWWSFWSMAVLLLLIVILGLTEFYTLLERAGYRPQKLLGTLSGAVLIAFSMYLFDHSFFPDNFPRLNMGISFFLLLLPLMLFLSLFSGSGSPIVNVSLSFFGILYIAVPFSLWSLTVLKEEFVYDLGNRIEYTPHYLLGFFFLVWSNDTFAYLVGKPLGRTKLFERISPKKTWEGFIGGVVLTQGVAYILSIYFTELPLRDWMVIGAIVSVFGTLGDLVESMFKRSLNVKDSGGILPGHGGILDRFDGVLLASPFVVTYLLLMR